MSLLKKVSPMTYNLIRLKMTAIAKETEANASRYKTLYPSR